MKTQRSFLCTACALAIPVALQSMLQSSFSIVDQIMIGQLGSEPISAVGFAGKFFSIFNVVVSAVGAVAGIMISQYLGQKNDREVKRSFYLNLWFSLGLSALTLLLGCGFPEQIMGLYTKDTQVRAIAGQYLRILCLGALPTAAATMLSTYFRCVEKPYLPMVATILSALANTVLNTILIFGTSHIPAMGVVGAGIATVIAQVLNFLVMVPMFYTCRKKTQGLREKLPRAPFRWGQYLAMLLPIIICELAWSLGENVYAAIYGHMSTAESAAMNLTNPVQGLVIGALCGISQAAGVIVGKRLGNREFDSAYTASKKLMCYGAVGACALSVLVALSAPLYVQIYRVEPEVKQFTCQILYAYALVAPFKVLNMILGGGIIRSGGKTKYVMAIDIIGTWCFGVPLGLLAAFGLELSVGYVYFALSLEECIRFGISLAVFHRKKWMHSLESGVATL